MSRLVIRPEAQADIRSARAWYDGERQGLGDEFLAELDHVLRRARDTPLQFPEVGRGLRRALLHRFPYAVYFVVKQDGSVVVLIVVHQRRRPAEWKRRANAEARREGRR
jgi:plasmid stabilization system protein ParE